MRGRIREKKQHDILQQAINLAGIIDDSDEMTVSNIDNTNALEATNDILPPTSPKKTQNNFE